MRHVIFSIKDMAYILNKRVNNNFDAYFVVTGDRGNGKSTLISKILYRFPKFNPKKHQVYSRNKIINLLKNFMKSFCFDDEAINSGYKRDFYQKGQKEMIKILTNYRDNFNIVGSALPNFFSLDKDLRDLVFMHIHVISRGIAVVHFPLQARLYSQDKWDSKNNEKIERSWTNKIKKDPNFKIPFHKLSTFAGYLYFNDLTPKQKVIYLQIKKEGRSEEYEDTLGEDKEKGFYARLYEVIINKKMTRQGLTELCLVEGKKYSVVTSSLNRMLKDNGIKETLSKYIQQDPPGFHNNPKGTINNLVPEIP